MFWTICNLKTPQCFTFFWSLNRSAWIKRWDLIFWIFSSRCLQNLRLNIMCVSFCTQCIMYAVQSDPGSKSNIYNMQIILHFGIFELVKYIPINFEISRCNCIVNPNPATHFHNWILYGNNLDPDETPSHSASHPTKSFTLRQPLSSPTLSNIEALWNLKQTRTLAEFIWRVKDSIY